jgi:hypothetical protein
LNNVEQYWSYIMNIHICQALAQSVLDPKWKYKSRAHNVLIQNANIKKEVKI